MKESNPNPKEGGEEGVDHKSKGSADGSLKEHKSRNQLIRDWRDVSGRLSAPRVHSHIAQQTSMRNRVTREAQLEAFVP
jgi:hypothetical protein